MPQHDIPEPAPHRAPWGWFHFQHPDPDVMEIHLLPASDVGFHAFDLNCACGCHEDAPGFITHMAYDGRERYESGQAKPH